MIEKNKINEILSKIDIVDVVREYLPGLKKLGRNYKTLCPFHSEKTPSFTVNQEKQMFFCFGCHSGGNAIKFVMNIENITFSEAVKKLADKVGILIDEKDFNKISQSDLEKVDIKKALSAAAAFYAKYLKSSQGNLAVEYLKKRGIKDETLRAFQIGLSPNSKDALIKELYSLGIKQDIARKAGLLTSRENGEPVDLFRDRIMFPIKAFNGDTIGFGGRTNGQSSPKYLNSPETTVFSKRNVLYGLHQALPTMRRIKKVTLVEGYMDVITLHQYGITFVISPLGTSLTQGQSLTIKRYCDEATIIFDPDFAGINAAIKAADQLIEVGVYPKICLLEENKDPDEFLIEKGAEAFYEKLQSAMDPIEFKIKFIKNNLKSQKPNDKSKAVSFLRETLFKQKDKIIKSEWTRKISQELDIPESVLLSASAGKEKESIKNEDTILKSVPPLEKGLIHIILKKPSVLREAENFSPQFLSNDFSRTVYSEILESEGQITIEQIAEKYPDYYAPLMALSMEEINMDTDLVSDFLQAKEMIVDHYHKRKWKEMKKNLNSLSPEEMKEFNKLSKIIKR